MGLTLDQLSDRTGYGRGTISDMESGKCVATTKYLTAVSPHFGLSPTSILDLVYKTRESED